MGSAGKAVFAQSGGPTAVINSSICGAIEEAKKLGFPDVVVQGTMSTTFISEMLTNRFGIHCLSFNAAVAMNIGRSVWFIEDGLSLRGLDRQYPGTAFLVGK